MGLIPRLKLNEMNINTLLVKNEMDIKPLIKTLQRISIDYCTNTKLYV